MQHSSHPDRFVTRLYRRLSCNPASTRAGEGVGQIIRLAHALYGADFAVGADRQIDAAVVGGVTLRHTSRWRLTAWRAGRAGQGVARIAGDRAAGICRDGAVGHACRRTGRRHAGGAGQGVAGVAGDRAARICRDGTIGHARRRAGRRRRGRRRRYTGGAGQGVAGVAGDRAARICRDGTIGQAQPLAAGSWQQALAQATRTAKSKRAAEEAHDLWFKSPLIAPKNTVEPDWHQYLGEAFYRLDPDWKDSGAWTTVLRSPDAEDYAPSEGWVREDLEGKGIGEVIMLASPALPEKLILVMETMVPKLKLGLLKGKRVYVCVPVAFRDRAEKALAPTGATFIYLDPDVPIPQRPERLTRYFHPDQE